MPCLKIARRATGASRSDSPHRPYYSHITGRARKTRPLDTPRRACPPTDIADCFRKTAKRLWLLSPSSGGSSSFTDEIQPFVPPEASRLWRSPRPITQEYGHRASLKYSIGVSRILSSVRSAGQRHPDASGACCGKSRASGPPIDTPIRREIQFSPKNSPRVEEGVEQLRRAGFLAWLHGRRRG
jgi:hypothetical protein